MTDTDVVTYVDWRHQRSPHGHVHLRGSDECLHREVGELCPSLRERAERAERRVSLAVKFLDALVETVSADCNEEGRDDERVCHGYDRPTPGTCALIADLELLRSKLVSEPTP